ncbi:uncharacterized protein LOC132731582 isoform X2 [Ruditapes philippinarum]|uniref:uncharacterized protein LOC132731582 isoform X2 n=1 Tax=Ruditapes philippinarum TaxID=129788 RepID=UPI00295AAF32|nr:uncharacterized protein LOC132731582 isoform X2 [Ruditapes philippinarum]
MAGKQMTKQDSKDIPNIQCAEDISLLYIPQLSTLAKCWNVDMSGFEEKKDIEDRLITFWTSNRKKENSDSWEPLELASAFTEYQKTKQSLLEKYRKAEALYNNFTHKIKANLELSHPNVCTLIKEREDSFKSGECTIVIAGDIGAGKTSLLNLILETQIFPVNSLKCTNTILEIRSSEKKDAVFYYKQQMLNNDDRERKLQPKIISLKSLDGIQEFKDCVAEYDLLDDNPYDRCEVFYPFKTLSKGLVIVDTPCIEGGGNIDQQLQTYFSRAFGLIYVINTNAAYGFQQSRLGKLLKTVVNSSEDFSPEASLFIGNKWEHVPEGDRADVQEDIFYKLNQVYPGTQQTQIQYMSVKKSTEFQMKYETKLEEHKILLLKVSQLVSSSFRQVAFLIPITIIVPPSRDKRT